MRSSPSVVRQLAVLAKGLNAPLSSAQAARCLASMAGGQQQQQQQGSQGTGLGAIVGASALLSVLGITTMHVVAESKKDSAVITLPGGYKVELSPPEGAGDWEVKVNKSGAQASKGVDPVGNFPLITDKHRSLTCKALKQDPSLYSKYANVRTPMGFTFDQAIQAGLDAPHLGVGIAAGEAAAYQTYKDIMDIVIEGWHGYKPTDTHKSDMDYDKIKMTPKQVAKFDKHIVSTRIRAGRSIAELALPPATDRKQRRTVEMLLKNALAKMTGELAGIYYPLGGMTKEQEDKLQADGFLFQKPTPNNVLANCGAARDWPDARGIFHNKDKTFLVWVNEEDHMRCISMQNGGNVKDVFKRWAQAINSVEATLKEAGYGYAHDEHLGYITTCPSNVGTGLRASVMLKLPKLYKKMGVHALEDLCDSMGLQARGGRGEHSPPGPNGEFDISNKGRIGASEVELVQRMIEGVEKLIDMEEAA